MARVSSKDVHRLFLQAVLSRGFLSAKLAQVLWEKSRDAVQAVGGDDVELAPAGDWDTSSFRQFQEEMTGREMYAIVNRKDDPIAQMATEYTPGEIAYFKAMVSRANHARSTSNPSPYPPWLRLREVAALKPKSNMSKTQAEVVLASFVAQGWLLRSKRGRYSLSTRAVLELLPYLKSTYPDEIAECTICLEMVTKGVACTTAQCQACTHYHCFKKYMRTRRRECPSCNNEWPGDQEKLIPIGEAAAREGDDGRRRVRKTSENDEDEEDEDEETGGEDEPSQPRTQRSRKSKSKAAEKMDVDEEEEEPQPRTQRSRKGKGKQSMVVDDDDDEEPEEDDEEDDTPVQKRRSSRRG
ncbi:hypothetical protein FB45DRAFT_1146824 [Roridomyces roridus]|uniref:Non-structural maintenance of chromosomes element 1 homolog n=1 Tax=Roridomyces roridus TaxID=1738132 RepID=A0AAD7FPW3_9AGAR|nr:hypothetical protein FB45DRAFT_1146824 [Roridomyces roridus]